MNHRYSNGLSILSNITWSHALDFNPYIGTGVPTFNVFDPIDLRKEHGNSSLDVRHRFVFAGIYQPPVHVDGWKKYLADGWRIAPVIQIQNGLPYTPTVSGGTSLGEFKSINGVGSSADRIDILGRNQVTMPKTANVDLRVGKNFYLSDSRFGSYRLEIFAEAFNLLNHQNNGTYLNANSNDTYSQRQMQISARLHF